MRLWFVDPHFKASKFESVSQNNPGAGMKQFSGFRLKNPHPFVRHPRLLQQVLCPHGQLLIGVALVPADNVWVRQLLAINVDALIIMGNQALSLQEYGPDFFF
jgi:hypothetical protein